MTTETPVTTVTTVTTETKKQTPFVNAGKTWDDEDHNLLFAALRRKSTYEQISCELGRSPDSIQRHLGKYFHDRLVKKKLPMSDLQTQTDMTVEQIQHLVSMYVASVEKSKKRRRHGGKYEDLVKKISIADKYIEYAEKMEKLNQLKNSGKMSEQMYKNCMDELKMC